MRAALVVHDKVLRTVIEAYDGFLFSHTGDGFVAAFASPMSAVNAAIDAQRGLGLAVRMGLVSGEAELRGGEYSGMVGRSCWPSRRRVCSAAWIWSIWGRAGCGTYPPRLGCFRSAHLACARSSHPCGRWMPVRGTCVHRPRASSDASRRSPSCKPL